MATVRKRVLPSGKIVWQVDYKDNNGNRRAKQFQKKRDADGHLLKVKNEIATGIHIPDREASSVQTGFDYLVKALKAEKAARSTIEDYESIYKIHIKPYLGKRLLTKIHPADVQDFVDLLKDENRSEDRIARARKLLGYIYDEAIRKRLAHINPVRALKKRRRTRRSEVKEQQQKVFVPEREVVKSMIDLAGRTDTIWAYAREKTAQGWKTIAIEEMSIAMAETPTDDAQIAVNALRKKLPEAKGAVFQAFQPAAWLRPLLATLAFAGLRIGEARGLDWSNLLDGFIDVQTAVDRYNVREAVKTAAGLRQVPIGPFLSNTLNAWKPKDAKPADLIFPTGKGTPITHSNIHNRQFQPLMIVLGLLDANGRPLFSMHDLRHFAVSLWIDEGADVKQVAEWVGHEDPAFTLKQYAHLFARRRVDRSAATAGEASVMGLETVATQTQHEAAQNPETSKVTRLSRKP